eukprot:CAMPEP_0205818194 /NCGR_PEP_ID=MMETSP0205-20121125/25477_1 /ASSEMBLY_ACC=CAM_ASM_000278 /TAXON_ID=36767 /ORGANISM="Euplotes focardii, Strain TN1" /LENGTH=86 /DNA_ID=CAMNT_0053110287 /DNA_START=245 /DNA_END=505 /DNA_ORIENTATION=+
MVKSEIGVCVLRKLEDDNQGEYSFGDIPETSDIYDRYYVGVGSKGDLDVQARIEQVLFKEVGEIEEKIMKNISLKKIVLFKRNQRL